MFRLTGGTDNRDISHSGMPYSQLKFAPDLVGRACVCMIYIADAGKFKKPCESTVYSAAAETNFTR